jgi:hypothetical protein
VSDIASLRSCSITSAAIEQQKQTATCQQQTDAVPEP